MEMELNKEFLALIKLLVNQNEIILQTNKLLLERLGAPILIIKEKAR